MDSNLNQMTVTIPSGFGMSGYACASAPVMAPALTSAALHGTGPSGAEAGVEAVVTGDLVVAADTRRRAIRKPFPGPTAWSPPTS